MIYDHTNAAGSICYDADANPKAKIERVISIDVRTGRVEVARYIDGRYVVDRERGEIETDVIEFERIDIAVGMDTRIKAFHCHGRKP